MQSMQETEKQRLLYEEKLRTLQAQFDIHMTESSEKVNALEIQIRGMYRCAVLLGIVEYTYFFAYFHSNFTIFIPSLIYCGA